MTNKKNCQINGTLDECGKQNILFIPIALKRKCIVDEHTSERKRMKSIEKYRKVSDKLNPKIDIRHKFSILFCLI